MLRRRAFGIFYTTIFNWTFKNCVSRRSSSKGYSPPWRVGLEPWLLHHLQRHCPQPHLHLQGQCQRHQSLQGHWEKKNLTHQSLDKTSAILQTKFPDIFSSKENIHIFSHTSYHQIPNIRGTFVGNKIFDNSDVVGASPVGLAPTTSSFSTLTSGFNGLGKDNCKTGRESCNFGNLVHLILEILQYSYFSHLYWLKFHRTLSLRVQ